MSKSALNKHNHYQKKRMVSVFYQDTCKLVESGVCSYHSMEANWRDLSKAISLKQHTVSTHTENINAVIESAITGFIWSHFVLNKNGLIYIRLLSVSTIQPLGSLCPHWNSWQKKSKGCKRRAHRLSFGPDNSTHAHFRVLWNENDRFACHKPADDGDRCLKLWPLSVPFWKMSYRQDLLTHSSKTWAYTA